MICFYLENNSFSNEFCIFNSVLFDIIPCSCDIYSRFCSLYVLCILPNNIRTYFSDRRSLAIGSHCSGFTGSSIIPLRLIIDQSHHRSSASGLILHNGALPQRYTIVSNYLIIKKTTLFNFERFYLPSGSLEADGHSGRLSPVPRRLAILDIAG